MCTCSVFNWPFKVIRMTSLKLLFFLLACRSYIFFLPFISPLYSDLGDNIFATWSMKQSPKKSPSFYADITLEHVFVYVQMEH